MTETSPPIAEEAVEQAFIDDSITREEAIAILGSERVEEIAYAKQVLAQDIAEGYTHLPAI